MRTNRCGNTCRQKCRAKGRGKEAKIQEFTYRDTMNVEHEMYDYTSNNWSHWNGNKRLKEKFGSYTRNTFDRFTTKAAILGTSHIIRKVLQCETGSLNDVDNRWFESSGRKKSSATRHNNNSKNNNTIIIITTFSRRSRGRP
jgi:hypothetical protein